VSAVGVVAQENESAVNEDARWARRARLMGPQFHPKLPPASPSKMKWRRHLPRDRENRVDRVYPNR